MHHAHRLSLPLSLALALVALPAMAGHPMTFPAWDALSPAQRSISMVFQSYALFPHMNVLDNVCYGPMSMRMDKAKARAAAAAATVGLLWGERLRQRLYDGMAERGITGETAETYCESLRILSTSLMLRLGKACAPWCRSMGTRRCCSRRRNPCRRCPR